MGAIIGIIAAAVIGAGSAFGLVTAVSSAASPDKDLTSNSSVESNNTNGHVDYGTP